MMNKICLSLLLVLCITSLFVACGNENNNKTNTSIKTPKANEEYFEWDTLDPTIIVGYTEKGLQQKELTVPAKCTGFGYAALEENTTVEKIAFESDDTVLRGHLFNKCTSLKNIELPQNITEIPDSCFRECTALETIEIPNGVTVIGKGSFYKCSNLKTVTLGNAVEEIKHDAFEFCENLTTINFPESLKIIGGYAFAYNHNLSNLKLEQTNVEEIGEWAFYNCHCLTSVKLPETLTSLGKMSFTYCDSLTEIYLPASLKEVKIASFGQRANMLTVYVKEGSVADQEFDTYKDGGMVKVYY